jgi:hypothetical protein
MQEEGYWMDRILTEQEKSFIASLIRDGVNLSTTLMSGNYWLDEEQTAHYLADRDSFEASMEGVTVEELRAFKAAEGATQCSATTKKGLPCKNYVQGGHPEQQYPHVGPVRSWLNKQGEYCHFHADGRDVARR